MAYHDDDENRGPECADCPVPYFDGEPCGPDCGGCIACANYHCVECGTYTNGMFGTIVPVIRARLYWKGEFVAAHNMRGIVCTECNANLLDPVTEEDAVVHL